VDQFPGSTPKADDKDGAFGTHGIFRAKDFQDGDATRTDMGVHAGREGVKDRAEREGERHATAGCIRTTEEAMAEIEEAAAEDPLTTIEVEDNKKPEEEKKKGQAPKSPNP